MRRSYAHRNTGAFVARQECDHAVCTLQTLHKRCKVAIVNPVIPAFENFKTIERIHYCDLGKSNTPNVLSGRFATM